MWIIWSYIIPHWIHFMPMYLKCLLNILSVNILLLTLLIPLTNIDFGDNLFNSTTIGVINMKYPMMRILFLYLQKALNIIQIFIYSYCIINKTTNYLCKHEVILMCIIFLLYGFNIRINVLSNLFSNKNPMKCYLKICL